MLRLKRTDIENAGITIDKIITLGTPHFGTIAAEYPFDELTTFVMALKFGQFWESPVFLSLAPTSGLILTQLSEIDNYYQGIEWYTISMSNAVSSESLILEGF